MKKALVTGAKGFIGSMMAKKFLDQGYDVLGWGNVAGELENGIHVIKVDMSNEQQVLEELNNNAPDVIVHCAGSADVGKSVQFPEVDYNRNVTVTHNLLFAVHKLHMEHVRFVFLSSAGVYGNPMCLPITEDMPLNPLSPYALHKVMCEEICKYFYNNYNMDIKIARIFSAYGKGLRKQIFWDMYNKLKNTGRLDMFGTGNESRDYIHINDVIESLYLLATVESKDVIFNVANGEEVTIRQATEWFTEVVGVSFDKIIFNGVVREGDPLNWSADVSKIKALGYKKTVDMKDGLKEYYDWVDSL